MYRDVVINRKYILDEILHVIRSTLGDVPVAVSDWVAKVYYRHVIRNIRDYSGQVTEYSTSYRGRDPFEARRARLHPFVLDNGPRVITQSYGRSVSLRIDTSGTIGYALMDMFQRNADVLSINVDAATLARHDNLLSDPIVYVSRPDVITSIVKKEIINPDSFEYKALQNGQIIYYFLYPKCTDLLRIMDWILSCPKVIPIDCTRLSVTQALRLSNQWHSELEHKRLLPLEDTPKGDRVEIEHGISDVACKIYILKDDVALDYEAKLQHNCLASKHYKDRLNKGGIIVLHFDGSDADGNKCRASVQLSVSLSPIRTNISFAESTAAKLLKYSIDFQYLLSIGQHEGPCAQKTNLHLLSTVKELLVTRTVKDYLLNYLNSKYTSKMDTLCVLVGTDHTSGVN